METRKGFLWAFGLIGAIAFSGCFGLIEGKSETGSSITDKLSSGVKNIFQTGVAIYQLAKGNISKEELSEWAKQNKKLKKGQKTEDFIADVSQALCKVAVKKYIKIRKLDSSADHSVIKSVEKLVFNEPKLKNKVIEGCSNKM
jgi:hypothetical protein